ncbi:hypothetical protein BDQ17DRAFT_1354606 [Cyathus striatus]|nr:hypothetical protein BDQ17DRAFT_1354606 [Cyathus striatus]
MPPQRFIHLSLIIIYDQGKGENHFKFKYLTNRSRATLAEDAEQLGLPRYKDDHTSIVTPGRAVRITWKDVAENGYLHIQLLDLWRRQWEQILKDLRIEDVKLEETIIEEKPYPGSSKRSYDTSNRLQGSSASTTSYKRVRTNSYSESQRDRQNYEQYDEVNPSFSEHRAQSRAGYGSTIHSPQHDPDLTATPFARKRPSPTSLADRVGYVASSEKPSSTLVERISPAPAAHFQSLSERIDARDPSPLAGGSLSARISGPPPPTSLQTASAHPGHHNTALSNDRLTPVAITRKSSQETAIPSHAGPLSLPPITPRHSKDAGSSSRFGPPVDLPPISTKAISPTASSRQATPGSVKRISASVRSAADKVSAQTQSSLSKDTSPTDNATLDGAAVPRVAAKSTQPSIPPPYVEELPSHEAYASTDDEAEDNRVEAALLTPTTTSTVHEVVEPQAPIAVTEGLTPPVPSMAVPMDVDVHGNVAFSESSPTEELWHDAHRASRTSALPPLTCSTNAQNEKLRAQVAALSKELESTKHDLENERRRRREAEAVVEDIQRECKEPFIVPALMDAFIKVSRLTTNVPKNSS